MRLAGNKVQKKAARLAAIYLILYSIRPEGRIICSPEQSKLCFEALETRFVPQNNLPLARGALKSLRSRDFPKN